MPRHALHARLLGFVHPVTNEELIFEEGLPQDFARVVEKWRAYTGEKEE